jgi:hypothetical protein
MSTILFSFTTPRSSESKESRGVSHRDYAMMKLYDDGKIVYRYFEKDDPKPELQNRTFALSMEELQAFVTYLKEKEASILSYAEKTPLPKEARKRLHTLVHAYGKVFLLPDYALDLKSSLYLDRYSAFPNPDTLPYYETFRKAAEMLSKDASAHGVSFYFEDHPEGDYPRYRPAEKR